MFNFKRKIPSKIKSFKNDLAPIIFYFDIFPIEPFQVPILPLPMRIDKLLNGQPTALILPNKNSISGLCQKLNLQFDLSLFISQGIINLIKYAKLKKKEITSFDLDINSIRTWWERSNNIMACIPDLIESFTYIILEFIKMYSYIREHNLTLNQEEYLDALIEYCSNIVNYFRMKIESNIFKTVEKNKIALQKLYFEKRNKVFPIITNIQVYERASSQYKNYGFVPYLIYDDILDCFFYNETQLKLRKIKPISLKVYEDDLIIKKGFSPKSDNKLIRTTEFNRLDIENLLEKID
ncbi:MAG: hypothetical protein EU535_05305 [Promethearchaeota archaeon]|nr:MAG: hypothetical protein EU535_05305 [Candidatus Lokiarchaeota archaeon]